MQFPIISVIVFTPILARYADLDDTGRPQKRSACSCPRNRNRGSLTFRLALFLV